MKRLGGVFDQITSLENLLTAAKKALRGKKQSPEAAEFFFSMESECLALQRELISGQYQPRPYRVFAIRDPKPRQICAVPFRDRVLQHAIFNVIDPWIEARFIATTYACRKGKGVHAALERAQRFARSHGFFFKGDIAKYFLSIDHQVLKGLLQRMFKDRDLLDLLARIIDHPVPGATPGKGIPIGSLSSQYFANMVLGMLDHHVKERMTVKHYLRYMDDFVLFAADKPALWRWREEISEFLDRKLGLLLNDRASFVAPVSEGIPFLGFRVFPGTFRLQARKRRRLVKRTRNLERCFENGYGDERSLAASVQSMIASTHQKGTQAFRRAWVKQRIGGASVIDRLPWNRVTAKGGSNRVNRGGSWNNNARNCRSANRNRNTPDNRNNNLGFRLASKQLREKTGDHGFPSGQTGCFHAVNLRRKFPDKQPQSVPVSGSILAKATGKDDRRINDLRPEDDR